MGVTIKDVAKKTGVSVTTVSLVLNKKNSRISEKTRLLIEEAARELNYVPSQTAVSLVTKKTMLIGLIVPCDSYYQYSDLVLSMEYACRNAGYFLNISLADRTPEGIDKQITDLLRYNVDGIVVDPSLLSEQADGLAQAIRNQSVPIITTDLINNEKLDNAILPDHKKGAFMATEHLLELGHTAVGLVSGSDSLSITSALVSGYREALESFGIHFSESRVYHGLYNPRTGHDGLSQMMEEGVTAILSASDNIAYGILRSAEENGLKIPEDLSLISYGSGSLITSLNIPLSSVSTHLDRIARKSVNLIRNYSVPASAEIIEPTLIDRGSTARKRQ